MELARKLSAWDASAVVIGTVIGGGIFLVPALIARQVQSPSAILVLWGLVGVLSFLGALAYAELGAMMPAAGGQHVYLRESWGPLAAFLCGWTTFVIIMPAQLGALAVGFSIYLGYFLPLTPLASKLCSIALILLLSVINYRGVGGAAALQNLMTVLKLLGMGTIIVAALAVPGASAGSSAASVTAPQLGAAMIACLLAYDGWNMVSCIAGEMKNPQRDFPKALALGLGVVAAVYILVNLAILHVLPVSTVAQTERVGAVVAERALGRAGAILVTLTILFSILGSLNGGVLTFPRIFYAQAADGLFFRQFALVHPVFRTPYVSIAVQGGLGAAAAVTGSYSLLITYAIFGGWIFYVLTVTGMIRLRRAQPDRARPFRMWGYPVTPAIFILVALWFLGNTLATQTAASFVGVGMILAGIPLYTVALRNAKKTPGSTAIALVAACAIPLSPYSC